MTTPLQNHHIIPKELFAEDNFLQNLPEFRDSQKYNLMGLPAELNGNFTQHLGSHPQYSQWVREQVALIDASGGTLVEKQAKLVGLTNVLKTKFAEPGLFDTLNGLTDGQVYNEFNDALTFDGPNSYQNTSAFKLGELADGALTAAQNGDWKVYVDGDSALNGFNFDNISASQQQVRLNKLNSALDAIMPEIETALRDPALKSQAKLDAARALDGVILGNLSEADAVATLRGDVPVTTYTGPNGKTTVLFSSSIASGLALNLFDLGHGSTIVDAVSLTLLGHGLVEMGAFSAGTSLTAMVRALASSNVLPNALSALDNIAVEIGKEVALSGVATLLGVGLLWKGYEIYQSVDGLVGALSFAAQYSDSELISSLNGTVQGVKQWLDDRFGVDTTYVPEHAELAALIESQFDYTTQQQIGGAIKEYLSEIGINPRSPPR